MYKKIFKKCRNFKTKNKIMSARPIIMNFFSDRSKHNGNTFTELIFLNATFNIASVMFKKHSLSSSKSCP